MTLVLDEPELKALADELGSREGPMNLDARITLNTVLVKVLAALHGCRLNQAEKLTLDRDYDSALSQRDCHRQLRSNVHASSEDFVDIVVDDGVVLCRKSYGNAGPATNWDWPPNTPDKKV